MATTPVCSTPREVWEPMWTKRLYPANARGHGPDDPEDNKTDDPDAQSLITTTSTLYQVVTPAGSKRDVRVRNLLSLAAQSMGPEELEQLISLLGGQFAAEVEHLTVNDGPATSVKLINRATGREHDH